MDTANAATRARLDEAMDGDLAAVSLGEFLELSLLCFFSGSELQREVPILYKGNYWMLSMCVSFVAPAEEIENLRKRQ